MVRGPRGCPCACERRRRAAVGCRRSAERYRYVGSNRSPDRSRLVPDGPRISVVCPPRISRRRSGTLGRTVERYSGEPPSVIYLRAVYGHSNAQRALGWRLREFGQESPICPSSWSGNRDDPKALAYALSLPEAPTEEVVRSYISLGDGLQAQGFARQDLGLCQDSVNAYVAALLVITNEAWPAAWAAVQHELGKSLRTLGWLYKEGGDPTAADATWRRSSKAFEAALAVRTRNSRPLEYATTRNSIGSNAISAGTPARCGAFADRDRCLPGRRCRAREPRLTARPARSEAAAWRDAEDIGLAAERHGAQRRGCASLTEAVELLRHVAGTRSRSTSPARWSHVQWDLGLALYQLAVQGKPGLLKESADV